MYFEGNFRIQKIEAKAYVTQNSNTALSVKAAPEPILPYLPRLRIPTNLKISLVNYSQHYMKRMKE